MRKPKAQMKRGVIFACVLLCLGMPLFARHKLSSLSTTIYNDSVSFGLGENQDDLRSYGTGISYVHSSGWTAGLLISGITLRNSPGMDGGRFDEIILRGGYNFHFHLNHDIPTMSWTITPVAGMVLAGDFGLDYYQNTVHKILNINPLHEPYEDNGARRVLPLMGIRQVFEYAEPSPWLTVSDLLFLAELEVYYVPTYMGRIVPSIFVGQHTLSTSQIMVGLGYAWEKVYDDWPSHVMVGLNETGLIFYLKGSAGIFSFDYQWHLNQMQGYGGFGMQLVFGEELSWTRSDLLVSFGMIMPSRISSIALRYALVNDIGIYIKNTYKTIHLADEDHVRENFSTWHMGGDFEFSQWDFGWARPFVPVGVGVSRFLVMKDAGPSSSDANLRLREFSAIRFSGEVAAGLRLFNKGELQYAGSAYGFELSGGLVFSATDNVKGSAYDLKLTEMWRPYVRFGLTVGSLL